MKQKFWGTCKTVLTAAAGGALTSCAQAAATGNTRGLGVTAAAGAVAAIGALFLHPPQFAAGKN